MSDCCSTKDKPASRRKQGCPGCGQPASRVSAVTLSHHLKAPWSWQQTDASYHVCERQGCEVVYFAGDGWIAKEQDVRTLIGLKHPQDSESLVCYCYGVSYAEAENNPGIKAFVIDQTRAHSCACETRNPTGRCCLKDFR